MKKLLTIIFSIHVFLIFGQNVSIIDQNLLKALIALNIDSNKDGQIQVTEAKSKTGSLNLSAKNITYMNGIEAFVNITSLSCANNNITTLDVTKLTKLTSITCSNNSLTSLNISGLTKLTSIVCYSNSLNELDVSASPNLTKLWCHDNTLNSLTFGTQNVLAEITCQNNQLTTLDLKNVTNLSKLKCYNNKLINELELTNLTKLTQVECYFNPDLKTICVSSLSITENPSFIKDSEAIWNVCTITANTTNTFTTKSSIIKAYNLQGVEISPSTKEEIIIVIYDNGKVEKIYQE